MAKKRLPKTKRNGLIGPQVLHDDADYLFTALNHPIRDSIFWWGQEDGFCADLRKLVVEIHQQFDIIKRRAKHETLIEKARAREFMERFERHLKIFTEIQLAPLLKPDYTATMVPSGKVDYDKSKQNIALFALFQLMQQGRIRYLKKCSVCELWFLANRTDKGVCSKACRQARYIGNSNYNEQRRENYAYRKTQPETGRTHRPRRKTESPRHSKQTG